MKAPRFSGPVASPSDPTIEPSPIPATIDTALVFSLMESRERWRRLGRAIFDLLFETDADGALTALVPLNWSGALPSLGTNANAIWDDKTTPFDASIPHIREILPNNVHLCALPYLDPDGLLRGSRGGLLRMPVSLATAMTSNAGILVGRIVLDVFRKTPDTRIACQDALDALRSFFDAHAAILFTDNALGVDAAATGTSRWTLMKTSGPPLDAHLLADFAVFDESAPCRRVKDASEGVALWLTTPLRAIGELGLFLFRNKPWSDHEIDVAAFALDLMAGFVETDTLHRHILKTLPIDLSSHLLNTRGFLAAVDRRLSRLDQLELPASLMVIRVEGLIDLLNTTDTDRLLSITEQISKLLEKSVRATDAIGRLGVDTFAIWMDSADRFAAAERADRICLHGAPLLLDEPHHLSIRIGVMCRESGVTDDPQELIEHAKRALMRAEDSNRPWQFCHEVP